MLFRSVFVLTLDSQFALNFQLLGGIWILQTIPTVLLGLFTERFADKRALLAGWAVGIAYGTIAAYNVSSPKASHFGGSTAAPFFLSSPMYIAISALILNLVVTLIWSGITSTLRRTRQINTTAPISPESTAPGTNAGAVANAPAAH